MGYLTNREFAVHEYNRQKRNAYADALAKEVRQLREEKQEREKGCEYCTGQLESACNDCSARNSECFHKCSRLAKYSMQIDIRENKSYLLCPMCGKSLKEVAND